MRRTKTLVTGLLASALGILALAVPASAGSPSQSDLEKAGWGCVVTPTISPDPHCARPGGVESVLAGQAGTMTFRVFEPDGTYLGKEFMIRGDVFRGFQADGTDFRCAQDPPTRRFTYLGPLLDLDYYACHLFDSDHT